MVCNRGGFVCAFCVLFGDAECREERKCKYISQSVAVSGIIFNHKGNMGNISSNTGGFGKREISDGNNVLPNLSTNIHNSVLTRNPKTMAETMALGWKLLFFFGYSIWGVSLLTAWRISLGDINFDAIPAPYKSVMYFFSFIFLATQAWRNYQKGRIDKIAADNEEYKLNRMKEHDKNKSQPKH